MIGLLGSAGFGDICARAKCFPSGSTSPALKLFKVNELILVHGLSFHSRITCLRGSCTWANCSTSMTIFSLVLTCRWILVFCFSFPLVGTRLVYLQVYVVFYSTSSCSLYIFLGLRVGRPCLHGSIRGLWRVCPHLCWDEVFISGFCVI